MNDAPHLAVKEVQFHVLNMRTRFPFQYGIASLTALPHLFVRAKVEVEYRNVSTGLGADGLPPKWFTKNPKTRFEEDIPAFFKVIGHATKTALDAPEGTFFELWKRVYQEQSAWAADKGIPPLLANLGVSLVERAVLDALCRSVEIPAHRVLRDNLVGIDLGAIRPELKGMKLDGVLNVAPLDSVHVRHTVGLGDPLTAANVPAGEDLDDGLPYTLEENIRTYGLNYYKIKVRGDQEADLQRLRDIAGVLKSCGGAQPRITLDGNEQFASVDSFREFYEACLGDPQIRGLFEGLLVVEQPLHRDVALQHDLHGWMDRPPMIIDESDGDLESLPTALDLGYDGTSHKNCKGILKGLANAALLMKRQSEQPENKFLLTGEDLANVGPIALNQDLAIVAALGIHHVERNGHHYFRGLSMFPGKLAGELAPTDLYRSHEEGFPTLDIRNGSLGLSSVNSAPFGTEQLLDSTQFTSLEDWSVDSLA